MRKFMIWTDGYASDNRRYEVAAAREAVKLRGTERIAYEITPPRASVPVAQRQDTRKDNS